VNITVLVLDNSTPQNNTLVNLTTTLANLSAASAYTDGSGMAVVRVNSTIAGIATVNASVLQKIFCSIAANITNFTASRPTMNLLIPHNHITDLSVATATYVTNSSNATSGNTTNFIVPIYPNQSNAEPNINTVGNITTLTWNLPNLG